MCCIIFFGAHFNQESFTRAWAHERYFFFWRQGFCLRCDVRRCGFLSKLKPEIKRKSGWHPSSFLTLVLDIWYISAVYAKDIKVYVFCSYWCEPKTLLDIVRNNQSMPTLKKKENTCGPLELFFWCNWYHRRLYVNYGYRINNCRKFLG